MSQQNPQTLPKKRKYKSVTPLPVKIENNEPNSINEFLRSVAIQNKQAFLLCVFSPGVTQLGEFPRSYQSIIPLQLPPKAESHYTEEDYDRLLHPIIHKEIQKRLVWGLNTNPIVQFDEFIGSPESVECSFFSEQKHGGDNTIIIDYLEMIIVAPTGEETHNWSDSVSKLYCRSEKLYKPSEFSEISQEIITQEITYNSNIKYNKDLQLYENKITGRITIRGGNTIAYKGIFMFLNCIPSIQHLIITVDGDSKHSVFPNLETKEMSSYNNINKITIIDDFSDEIYIDKNNKFPNLKEVEYQYDSKYAKGFEKQNYIQTY